MENGKWKMECASKSISQLQSLPCDRFNLQTKSMSGTLIPISAMAQHFKRQNLSQNYIKVSF
jgi:ABC-type phosphate/phosphonate transport system substrate-binding protein